MQTLTHRGEILPWSSFLGAMRTLMSAQQAIKGAGLRILTESVCSPTLAAQIDEVRERLPASAWHQWDPAADLSSAAGLRMVAGSDISAHYNLEDAAVIVSLDSDFLSCGAGHLRYARQFARRRRPEGPGCRLYCAETMPTSTGAKADHRLPLRPTQIESLARALAADLGVAGVNRGTGLSADVQRMDDRRQHDLNSHRGACVVIAGEGQPPVVHALAHAMNVALGNAGRTVLYTDPIEPHPVDQIQSIRELAMAMETGQVDTLLIIGGNPVFTAPADLRFADLMNKVRLRVHLGLARERNVRTLSLADSRSALSGDLERCSSLRRNRLDRSAPDRAAVRRSLGP